MVRGHARTSGRTADSSDPWRDEASGTGGRRDPAAHERPRPSAPGRQTRRLATRSRLPEAPPTFGTLAACPAGLALAASAPCARRAMGKDMPDLDRRQFLALAAALGAALATGCTTIRPSSSGWRERRDLYPHGVASGDPDENSRNGVRVPSSRYRRDPDGGRRDTAVGNRGPLRSCRAGLPVCRTTPRPSIGKGTLTPFSGPASAPFVH